MQLIYETSLEKDSFVNMKTLRIALVDDMASDRLNIRSLLQEYTADAGVSFDISEYASARDLLSVYCPRKLDAVFLDIYMDEISGIEAARRLREIDRDILILFLTSSNDHMPEAWRVHAFDYIQKPVTGQNLFPAMDDIVIRIAGTDTPAFSFTNRGQEYSISYDDLVMVETGSHNYLEITVRSDIRYSIRMTMAQAGDILLKDPRFLPVRRGVIVNMAYIRNFSAYDCILSNGISVPVSLRSRRKLEQAWDRYLMDQIRAETVSGREV